MDSNSAAGLLASIFASERGTCSVTLTSVIKLFSMHTNVKGSNTPEQTNNVILKTLFREHLSYFSAHRRAHQLLLHFMSSNHRAQFL